MCDVSNIERCHVHSDTVVPGRGVVLLHVPLAPRREKVPHGSRVHAPQKKASSVLVSNPLRDCDEGNKETKQR